MRLAQLQSVQISNRSAPARAEISSFVLSGREIIILQSMVHRESEGVNAGVCVQWYRERVSMQVFVALLGLVVEPM